MIFTGVCTFLYITENRFKIAEDSPKTTPKSPPGAPQGQVGLPPGPWSGDVSSKFNETKLFREAAVWVVSRASSIRRPCGLPGVQGVSKLAVNLVNPNLRQLPRRFSGGAGGPHRRPRMAVPRGGGDQAKGIRLTLRRRGGAETDALGLVLGASWLALGGLLGPSGDSWGGSWHPFHSPPAGGLRRMLLAWPCGPLG